MEINNNSRHLVWCGDNWSKYSEIKVGGCAKAKGGLGDRIRGMISVKSWSRVLGLKFSIIWDEDKLENLFDFPNYHDLDINKDDIGVYSMLNSEELQKILSTEKPENIFNNKINKVISNSHNWKFILRNPYIDNQFKNSDLDKEEFNILYTKIFVPKPKMLNIVSSIIKDHQFIIGIQLRTGDRNMGVGKGIRNGFDLNSDNRILNLLHYIKKHLELTNISDYSIFLTSDYTNIFILGKQVWSEDKIIYYNKKICHIDKCTDKSNVDKTFIDSYILSQKTKIIYGSLTSGFSKISCLSSVHNNFYNILHFENIKDEQQLLNISKITKKTLLKWKNNIL